MYTFFGALCISVYKLRKEQVKRVVDADQHVVAVSFMMFFLIYLSFCFEFRYVNSSLKLWRRVNMVGFGSVPMD
jgi:hypothetical protein